MKFAVVLSSLFALSLGQYAPKSGGGGGQGFGGGISLGGGGGQISLGGGGGQISLGGGGGGGGLSFGGGSTQVSFGGSSGAAVSTGRQQVDIAGQLGAPSAAITSRNFDIRQLAGAAAGAPAVEIGTFGEEFGHNTEVGEVTTQDGGEQVGQETTRDGEVQVGEPIERLLGYTIVRHHERVVPIYTTRFRQQEHQQTINRHLPVITRTYVRQPIVVKTSHQVEKQNHYPHGNGVQVPRIQG